MAQQNPARRGAGRGKGDCLLLGLGPALATAAVIALVDGAAGDGADGAADDRADGAVAAAGDFMAGEAARDRACLLYTSRCV